jgi:adenosylcobinamide-GDP ribazoletransferase
VSPLNSLRDLWSDLLTSIQFLTRIPTPTQAYSADSLARSVKFFPIVGVLVGGGAALLHSALTPHLPRLIAAILVVTFMLLITGCLHEDGLADTADGFGGGWDRAQILTIMRDSRIGTYGAAAIAISLLLRVAFISALPLEQGARYLIAAHVMCRWSTLPLSYFLPPARTLNVEEKESQGARIAKLTTLTSLTIGTLISFAMAIALLRERGVIAIILVIVATYLSGLYYKRRIGGVTGDCFGATNQFSEILVYLCGVWVL